MFFRFSPPIRKVAVVSLGSGAQHLSQVTWRLLLTNTFPNPVVAVTQGCTQLNTKCVEAERTSSTCILSCAPLTVNRFIRKDTLFLNNRTAEQWETVLLPSSDPEVQVQLVQMAKHAAEVQGLLAAT